MGQTSCVGKRVCFVALAALLALSGCSKPVGTSDGEQAKPNIVIFYVDDLGYGDVGAYGATAVATPNIDALASNGIRFTDAHAGAATCTPSRYALLTGEFAFRKKAKVLEGDAPLIIGLDKPTLPKMLQKHGYATAVVGKWHLGLGDGITPVDWNTSASPGPNEIGFDYSFLLPSTGDRVPSVYTENGKVIGLDPADPLRVSYVKKIGERPTGTERPDLLRQQADPQHSNTIINGISRIGYMEGGVAAEWKDEDFYRIFTDKAVDFMNSVKDEQPFMLFFSFHDIHVPRLPHPRFEGTTTMGPRGDAIVQTDFITGEVVEHLRAIGKLENTIIIFTSDNGPVLDDGYADDAIAKLGDHQPAGPFRGGKYSAYEAGTRVPTILHYPAGAKVGVSDALMSQVDIYASIAALLGQTLQPNEAIDSENTLQAWLDPKAAGRNSLLQESFTLSLRTGNWKYIAPTTRVSAWIENDKGIESGLTTEPQLFNLGSDIAESGNLAATHPEKVKQFQARIEEISARTTR